MSVLLTFLIGFVSVNGFAIESRSNAVNEEVYGKYVCNGKPDGARIMVPKSCSKYFQCNSNESAVQTCTSPTPFFDSLREECVATSSCIEPKGECSTAKPKPTTPCSNKKTTATPTTVTTLIIKQIKQQTAQEVIEQKFVEFFASSGHKCDSPGGSCRGLSNGSILPHKTNCKMYLACFGGCAAEILCPGSLNFNHETLRCDKPENVKCNS